MESSYPKLLGYLRSVTVPDGLEARIMLKIGEERRVSLKRKALWLAGLSLTSFAGIISASLYLWRALHSSGAYQYFSLMVSDGATTAAYWKEFSMTLAESFPFVASAILLSVLAIFIWSGMRALKNSRLAFIKI